VTAGNRPLFRVSHVFLDVDGTLVDYGSAIRAAFLAAAARASELAGEEVTPEAINRARASVTYDPAWRGRSITDQRRESVRRVLAASDAAADEAAVLAVARAYEEARDRSLIVFPDVEEALAALVSMGLTLIAASNGDVNLDRVGIGHYLSGTHYAAHVGVSKPDPRFFALAVERHGVTASASLVVGDRLDNDYQPAVAAGLHAVLIDRAGAVDIEGVLRVAALTDLPALIERG
jgi:HAD superfamily hydrolase (TIGR01509 family)